MNPAYIPIFMLFVILLIMHQNQNAAMIGNLIEKSKKKRSEDRIQMVEMAKKFIDKECIIYTFNNSQLNGIIKEVSDGAMLVESNGTIEAVNLDFIVRIREYPRKKNGKKKSVVID